MNGVCDDFSSPVVFWGFDIRLDISVIHVIFNLIVIVVYSVEDLRKTYNRSVIRHNACLFAVGFILIVLGGLKLCNVDVNDIITILVWSVVQYFIIATALWLNVICFDMTLVITRFQWLPGSLMNTEKERNRKFQIYSAFAWIGALLPTVATGIMEYYLTDSSPLKPRFTRYKDGARVAMNIHIFLIPTITLFFNNLLFIFTTYKIVGIRRSTRMANGNKANILWQKYNLFLWMYLLMGAPWFFGTLMAQWNSLLLLNMHIIVQPIVWLIILPSVKKFVRKIADKLFSTGSVVPISEKRTLPLGDSTFGLSRH